jgi:cobalt transporter subunit CbtB
VQEGHWETGKAAPSRKTASQETCRDRLGFPPAEFEHTEGVPLMTAQRIAAESFSLSQRLIAGFSVLAFGSLLLFAVGLAHSERLHNAAHDTRHAIGFPCH